MAKTPSAEPCSEIRIAGKSYKLRKAGGAVKTLPKGADCSKTSKR